MEYQRIDGLWVETEWAESEGSGEDRYQSVLVMLDGQDVGHLERTGTQPWEPDARLDGWTAGLRWEELDGYRLGSLIGPLAEALTAPTSRPAPPAPSAPAEPVPPVTVGQTVRALFSAGGLEEGQALTVSEVRPGFFRVQGSSMALTMEDVATS